MTREIDFRYTVMRNAADYIELQPSQDSAPSLRMEQDAEIKTSLSGTFLQDERFDPLTDEIRAEMILDGVTHPLGVFAVAECRKLRNETEATMQIEGFDRCWRVRDTCTENLLHLAAGTAYLDAVATLLTAAGIAVIVRTPNAATLSEAREDWPTGTSYLTIINDLLSEINYKQLWFDSTGAAVLEPVTVPSAANIMHTLSDADVRSLVLPELESVTDIYSAPNVFLCVCSNADKANPMTARSENSNPQSPLSIPRRGRRITKVVKVNNIADQNALQAYADQLRNESMYAGETISLRTALLPGYGVADVTALRIGELLTICIESAWTMELTVGGTMEHTLERVVVNIG